MGLENRLTALLLGRSADRPKLLSGEVRVKAVERII